MKKEVQPLDWFDHVASLPQYKQLMLRNINIVDENYIDKIKSQPVTLCTDGSVYSTTSGGGWVLATNDGTILVTVWNSDTAHYSYQNSYRSEAQAKLAGHIFLHETCKFFDIPQVPVRSICDNSGLVIKICSNKSVKDRDTASDIFKEIMNLHYNTKTYVHVKGHQDTQTTALSNDAYLNMVAGYIARHNTSLPVQLHPPNMLAIFMHDNYMPHSITTYLRRYSNYDRAKQKLKEVNKWTNEIFNSIDWGSHRSLFTSCPFRKQVQHLKYVH